MNGDAALEGILLLGLAGLGALLLVRGYFAPFAQGLSDAVTGKTTKVAFLAPLSGAAAGQGALATSIGTSSPLASAQASITSRVTTIEGH